MEEIFVRPTTVQGRVGLLARVVVWDLTSQRVVTRGLYQSERFTHTIPVPDLRTPGVDLHVQVPHVKIHRTYSEGTQSRCYRDQVVQSYHEIIHNRQ